MRLPGAARREKVFNLASRVLTEIFMHVAHPGKSYAGINNAHKGGTQLLPGF